MTLTIADLDRIEGLAKETRRVLTSDKSTDDECQNAVDVFRRSIGTDIVAELIELARKGLTK